MWEGRKQGNSRLDLRLCATGLSELIPQCLFAAGVTGQVYRSPLLAPTHLPVHCPVSASIWQCVLWSPLYGRGSKVCFIGTTLVQQTSWISKETTKVEGGRDFGGKFVHAWAENKFWSYAFKWINLVPIKILKFLLLSRDTPALSIFPSRLCLYKKY